LTLWAYSTITLYVRSFRFRTFTFVYARTVTHLSLVHLIQDPKFIGLVVPFTFNYDTREYFYRFVQSIQLKTEPRLTASLTDLHFRTLRMHITYHMLN